MSPLPFESKSTSPGPGGRTSAIPLASSSSMQALTLTDFETEDDEDELLNQYRMHREESVFHAIVRRHLPAVAAAARRLVNGDAALAEDICQEVFTHLALHAAKLPPRVVLGGWLHRHTCFTAAKTLRAAIRRRSREQVAAADAVMHASDSSHSFNPSPSSGFGSRSGSSSGAGHWLSRRSGVWLRAMG